MVNESSNTTNSSSIPTAPISSKSFSFDESAGLQPHIPSEIIQDDLKQQTRRRSSNISDYSLKDAKNAIQSSTEDLLFPRLATLGNESIQTTSPWHSAPLAFAFFPALAGVLFTNGSGIVTDVMLLGLAAIFLNWSVRLPWDWYHAAQIARQSVEGIRKKESCKDKEDDDTTIHEVPEEEEFLDENSQDSKSTRYSFFRTAGASELSRDESVALLSCFLFPLFGAYLLHSLRSQLKRPSDGLVSNYNLTIFLLASELRPAAHLVKLIQSKTFVLSSVMAYKSRNNYITTEFARDISKRLENLEARYISNGKSNLETQVGDKQLDIVSMEVRKTLQPDLDALTRAIRRYEKRATLQAFQIDTRLEELETRLNDYISLAAAAANNGKRQHVSVIDMIEWIMTLIIQPFRIFNALISLPFSLIIAAFQDRGKSVSRKESPSYKIRKPVFGKLPSKTSFRSKRNTTGKGE